MTTFPHWNSESFEANFWNIVWLGDFQLPGKAEVQLTKSRRIDVQTSPGSDGAYLVDKGIDPAQISITLSQWNEEQWSDWVEIFPQLDPQTAGTKRRPLEIYHPLPLTSGISTVYVQEISVNHPESGGVRTINIKCIQWFPAPKPAKTKKDPKKKASNGAVEPAVPVGSTNVF